jgi:hypothetical protein
MVCLRREGITAKQQFFVYTVVDEKGDVYIVGLAKKTGGLRVAEPAGTVAYQEQ